MLVLELLTSLYVMSRLEIREYLWFELVLDFKHHLYILHILYVKVVMEIKDVHFELSGKIGLLSILQSLNNDGIPNKGLVEGQSHTPVAVPQGKVVCLKVRSFFCCGEAGFDFINMMKTDLACDTKSWVEITGGVHSFAWMIVFTIVSSCPFVAQRSHIVPFSW